MNFKNNKGSITLFVLVGLLFMASVLMLLYAFTVNKSKIVKEQYNIISDIYSHKDGDANAYDRAYTYLRGQNKQTATKTVENVSVIELENTFKGNLSNYRIYGNGVNQEGNNLPAEYQEVEYIESTGTQYIDTGVVPTSQTGVEISFSDFENTTWSTIFGSITAYVVESRYRISSEENGDKLYAFLGDKIKIEFNSSGEHNIKFNRPNGVLNLDNIPYDISSTTFISSNLPICLFAENNSANGIISYSKCKILKCKIYEKDNLIRDFIPVKRNFDDAIGLYDRVNNVFYENEGTGEFVVGHEVGETVGDLVTTDGDANSGKYKISIKSTDEAGKSVTKDIYLNEPLEYEEYIDFKMGKVVRRDRTEEFINFPEIPTYEDCTKIEVLTECIPARVEVEYKKYDLVYSKLEYIESTGTQYIDTGVVPTRQTGVEISFSDFENTTWSTLFGSVTAYVVESRYKISSEENGDKLYAFCGDKIKIEFNSTGEHNIKFNRPNGILNLDNIPYDISSTTFISSNLPICLFAENNSAKGIISNSKCKILNCKIYEKDNLIRDFIPAKRNSDGAIGLYDKVNDVFYENAGTGEFVAGPEV